MWGTGEPVVHEDEWTVGQAAQAPQERNRVESKERRFESYDDGTAHKGAVDSSTGTTASA